MNKNQEVALFNQKTVRRHWNADEEKWYFSVIDVVAVLTDSLRPRKYWSDLKIKIQKEGGQLSEKIGQLKMQASDKKYYLTEVADTQTILRLIQSIPSPKAEPFKLWLAQVGYERLEETADPEQSIDRAMKTYLQKGYSKDWINQRLQSIQVRKELTDEWQNRGMRAGAEFATLSDEITKAWANHTVRDYKHLKGLKKENLRDNMTTLELVLNMLAEASTTAISKKKVPLGLRANRRVAREGGTVAKIARTEIERQTGVSVITPVNAKILLEKPKPDKK